MTQVTFESIILLTLAIRSFKNFISHLSWLVSPKSVKMNSINQSINKIKAMSTDTDEKTMANILRLVCIVITLFDILIICSSYCVIYIKIVTDESIVLSILLITLFLVNIHIVKRTMNSNMELASMIPIIRITPETDYDKLTNSIHGSKAECTAYVLVNLINMILVITTIYFGAMFI